MALNERQAVKIGTYLLPATWVKEITWTRGDRATFEAGTYEAPHDLIDVDDPAGGSLDITVNINRADTQGQVALDAAYSAGSLVTVVYAPEGFVTGNPTETVQAYVTSVPKVGGARGVQSGAYKLSFKTKPTPGTVSA